MEWSEVALHDRTMCSNRPSTGTLALTSGGNLPQLYRKRKEVNISTDPGLGTEILLPTPFAKFTQNRNCQEMHREYAGKFPGALGSRMNPNKKFSAPEATYSRDKLQTQLKLKWYMIGIAGHQSKIDIGGT